MGRGRNVALAGVVALLALGGAAALVLTGPRGEGTARDRATQAAAGVNGRLREVAAEVRARAQTLAELPRLAVAVATDERTVRDLTEDELAFRPRAREVIEIAQAPKGGAYTPLLRLPDTATVAVPHTPGLTTSIENGELRIAFGVSFAPRARADELDGFVVVSTVVDPIPLETGLAAFGGARIEGAGGEVLLGWPGARPADAPVVAAPLAEVGEGLRLVIPRPELGSGPGGKRLGAAIGLAVVGLGAAFWLARRRPATPAVAAPAPQPRLATPVPDLRVVALPTGGAAAPARDDRVGQYTLVRLLGTGGMADVYLARAAGEAGFERLVALKVMHDELANNPKFVSHFLDEARLAAKLVHPNIVAITDLGRAGGKYVIAMEYVDGSDLERLIRGSSARGAPIPVGVAIAIVRKLCDGLHAAHTAVDGDGNPLGLVHRDVKSANVLVGKNGSVKLADFGIAKIKSTTREAKTEVGELKGTAAYMSPEHRLGMEIDARSDLYAAAAILYELISGKEINLDLAMIAHLGKAGWPHLAPPSVVRPGVPKELDAVVFRAMAFEAADRYPTCEAFEEALAEIVESRGVVVNDKAVAAWIDEEIAQAPAPAVTAAETPARDHGA